MHNRCKGRRTQCQQQDRSSSSSSIKSYAFRFVILSSCKRPVLKAVPCAEVSASIIQHGQQFIDKRDLLHG